MTTKFLDTGGRVMDYEIAEEMAYIAHDYIMRPDLLDKNERVKNKEIAEEMAYIEKPFREDKIGIIKSLFISRASQILKGQKESEEFLNKKIEYRKELEKMDIVRLKRLIEIDKEKKARIERERLEMEKIKKEEEEREEQERLEKIEEEKRIAKEQEEFELRKKKFEEDRLKREEELKIRNFNAREFLVFREDYLEKIRSGDLNVLDEIMRGLGESFLYSDNSLKSINSKYVSLISRIKSLETDILKYPDILEALDEAKKPVKEKLDKYESEQAFIRRQEEDERKRRAQIQHHRRTVACVKRRRRLLLF